MQNRRLKIDFIGVFIGEDFFIPVKKGMSDAAAIMDVDVRFMGDEGSDTDTVNRLICESVDDGIDGIAVDIVDPEANKEAIAYAVSQGVPVVAYNMDASMGRGAHLAYTQQDFLQAGRKLADRIANEVPVGSTVLVTQHDEGVEALEKRAEGAMSVLNARNPDYLGLITSAEVETSFARVTNMLEENPHIEVIIATGQADTEGAGLAVRHLGRRDIIIAGFDLSPTILELIAEGYIRFTVDQQPYVQGFYPVVQLALNIRYGLTPCNIDAGAGIVTSKDVAAIIEMSEKHIR